MKLVLLPGLDGTGDLFQPLVSSLSDSVEPIICRYPSDASLGYQELLSVAESFLPLSGPYVLLGESFSGPISVQIASKNPPGIRGLILVNTFLSDPRPVLGKIIRAAPDVLLKKPPGHLLNLIAAESEDGVKLVESLQNTLAKIPPDLVRARLRCVAGVDVRDIVPRMRVPIKILRSTNDWAVPEKSINILFKLTSGVTETIVPGNHFILQASPSRSAEAIEQFCSGLHERVCDEA